MAGIPFDGADLGLKTGVSINVQAIFFLVHE
jgi:hypothetical protein